MAINATCFTRSVDGETLSDQGWWRYLYQSPHPHPHRHTFGFWEKQVFQKLWLRKKRKVKIKRGGWGIHSDLHTTTHHTPLHHSTDQQRAHSMWKCLKRSLRHFWVLQAVLFIRFAFREEREQVIFPIFPIHPLHLSAPWLSNQQQQQLPNPTQPNSNRIKVLRGLQPDIFARVITQSNMQSNANHFQQTTGKMQAASNHMGMFNFPLKLSWSLLVGSLPCHSWVGLEKITQSKKRRACIKP